MITEDLHDDLIKSLEASLANIAEILKCLGNETRCKIMIKLLHGPQSFGNIVNDTKLKKTAVSNHLNQLMEVNLIQRKDDGIGIYEMTGDGLEFMRSINNAYQESPSRQLEKFEALQRRGISSSFLRRFSQY